MGLIIFSKKRQRRSMAVNFVFFAPRRIEDEITSPFVIVSFSSMVDKVTGSLNYSASSTISSTWMESNIAFLFSPDLSIKFKFRLAEPEPSAM